MQYNYMFLTKLYRTLPFSKQQKLANKNIKTCSSQMFVANDSLIFQQALKH